jgi:WD40 repeat protein
LLILERQHDKNLESGLFGVFPIPPMLASPLLTTKQTANSTIEAHETKGVNFVDFYPQSDKPYMLSSSDDRTVKVWDYTTKSLIATLEGHTNK